MSSVLSLQLPKLVARNDNKYIHLKKKITIINAGLPVVKDVG